MGNKNKKNELKPKEIIYSDDFIKFLLDTNVVFAYLNSNNPFHLEAKTSIDALNLKKNVWIILSHLSIGEFIAHRNLIGKGSYSIRKALEALTKFLNSLNRHLHGGVVLDTDTIIKRYKKHSKRRVFTKASFTDFMLLAQAEEIKNIRILTCDKNMHRCGKTVFEKNIYYLPNESGISSDYPRLMLEIQNDFKQ